MQLIANDTSLPGFFPGTVMPDPDWWQALWPDPKRILDAVGIRPDMEVIDLCCRDGLFTVPLALMSRRVIGIDLDPGMLGVARIKLAATGAANWELVQGDAYDTAKLVHEPVDCVLIANTFHGVPDKLRLARTVATILKPGGRFAVVNWHRRTRDETPVLGKPRGPKTEMRMAPSDVAAVVEPAGLRLSDIIELPPYHYGAIYIREASDGRENRSP